MTTVGAIQQRGGTAAQAAVNNEILRAREIAVETDTGKFKIGDGSRRWNELPYSGVIIGTGAEDAKAGDYTPTYAEVVASLGFTPLSESLAGQAGGVATLDGSGKVPSSQLTIDAMQLRGTYNASTNTPALANGTGNQGDVYVVSVGGSRNFGSGSVTLKAGDQVMYNGTIWERSSISIAVSSVADLTGDVTAAALKAALSVDQVDNTRDAVKPVSAAVQAALNGKEPSIAGGAAGRYWDGTKTFQPLNRAAVGLSNVDNTSDAGKPVSAAQQAALDLKQSVSLKDAPNGYAGLNGVGKLTADTTGNATTATKLATVQTIFGAAFDGSAAVAAGNFGYMPPKHGFKAWSYDPVSAAASTAVVGGTLYVTSIPVPVADTISSITVFVTGNGSTLTTGQNLVALFQNGALLAVGADQSSAWASPGAKTVAITPQSVAAGDIQVVVLANGTTPPSFATKSAPLNRDLLNIGLSGTELRHSTADTGRTSMPTNLGTQASSTVAIWAAVS